jgi:hypothetical protein
VSRIPRAVAAAVEERRGGSCEATGWPWLHVEYHHRRPYRAGGRPARDPIQNTAANLLAVCPLHHRWAHAQGPDDWHMFMLHEGDDPTKIAPVPDPMVGRCGV